MKTESIIQAHSHTPGSLQYIRVTGDRAKLKDWPEIEVITHRQVWFPNGGESPSYLPRRYKCACLASGLALMGGRVATNKAEAVRIANEQFNSLLTRSDGDRARVLNYWHTQRDDILCQRNREPRKIWEVSQ